MTRLLTRNICTMTELREPQKVLDGAGGQPVAVLKNSKVVAHFVPQEYIEQNGIKSMDGLLRRLGAADQATSSHTLSDRAIISAIQKSSKKTEALHEHLDCIRIAYEWLDAQPKLSRKGRNAVALKHLIEAWGGRYVSQSDVEVAASLHPEVNGSYPEFNLSSKMVEPSVDRLARIPQAMTQLGNRERHNPGDYRSKEDNTMAR